MIKELTYLEPPGKLSTEDTTIAWRPKKDVEDRMAQATTTDRVGTVNSETTYTSAHKVLFEVGPTKVAFSLRLRTG